MGKMKDLEIRIDEIMKKIGESLDGLDEMRKSYIYNSISMRCNFRAARLTDKMIHNSEKEIIDSINRKLIL